MKSYYSLLCFVVLALSTVALAQKPEPSAAPWREGKSMGAVDREPQSETESTQTRTEIQSYAPYSIALLPTAPGGEVVLPFVTTDNKVVFFRVAEVQKASQEKRLLGRPISYGELIALIGELQIKVNQLKEENEKLWAVVGKPSLPQTIVVQTPSAPEQATAEARAAAAQADAQRRDQQRRQALLMFLMGQQPQRVNMNVNVTDCTKSPALCVNH